MGGDDDDLGKLGFLDDDEKIDFSSSFLWAMTIKFCCKARANG